MTTVFNQSQTQTQTRQKTSCFLFHNWGKWKVIDSGEILSVRHNHTVGHFIEQRRVCERCGKMQLNTQKTSIWDNV